MADFPTDLGVFHDWPTKHNWLGRALSLWLEQIMINTSFSCKITACFTFKVTMDPKSDSAERFVFACELLSMSTFIELQLN